MLDNPATLGYYLEIMIRRFSVITESDVGDFCSDPETETRSIKGPNANFHADDEIKKYLRQFLVERFDAITRVKGRTVSEYAQCCR